jgi:hypothetical protein
MTDRRSDTHQAQRVDAALRIDALWGCVSAWHYLRARGTTRAVAMRVLDRGGPRRRTDAQHPAVRDALPRGPDGGIGQRAALATDGGLAAAIPRSNVAAAYAVERAIELATMESRQYAESLLRIYGLSTATVMRVLFEPHRRRRGAAQPTSAAGIR